MSQDTLASNQQQQAAADMHKYKQKCHDLQKQLSIRDKEIMNRQAKLKESHEMEQQMLQQDYEKQMPMAKKKIK